MQFPRQHSEKPKLIEHYSKYDREKIKKESQQISQSLDFGRQKYNHSLERKMKKERERTGRRRINTREQIQRQMEEEELIKQGKKRPLAAEQNQKLDQEADKQKAKKPKVKTDFQRKLEEHTKSIDDLVKTIDQDTLQFQINMMSLENEVEELQEQSRINQFPEVPGQKIAKLLDEMSQQPVSSTKDIKMFQKEMWMTLQQFEKNLQEEEKGYQIRFNNQRIQYESQIQRIKYQT